jgi:tight adherence protein C
MTPQILFVIMLGIAVFCLIALIVMPMMERSRKVTKRALDIMVIARPDQQVLSRRQQLEGRLLRLLRGVRTRFGMGGSIQSANRLAAAGYRRSAAPDVFFAAQFLTPLACAFGASFITDNTLFWVMMCAGVGYLAPGIWLSEKTRRRRDRIRRSLPDTIDLLVICVDAGLGLDQALLRVSQEIAVGHPDMYNELTRVHLEQRAGRPRLETWQNLTERVKLTELTAFASMLTQSDRFGTPIAKSLSTFAEDLRLRRRQQVEEVAAKTKIKILFPLVFCIFPCLFIVLLGPAVLEISSGLQSISK